MSETAKDAKDAERRNDLIAAQTGAVPLATLVIASRASSLPDLSPSFFIALHRRSQEQRRAPRPATETRLKASGKDR